MYDHYDVRKYVIRLRRKEIRKIHIAGELLLKYGLRG